MPKLDFDEVRTEGRQFWQGLTLGGKIALAVVALAVYLAGYLSGGIVWALLSRAWS